MFTRFLISIFCCGLFIFSCHSVSDNTLQKNKHEKTYQTIAEVKGMSCPFCVSGVEKQLYKIPGVVRVETNLKTGIVHIYVHNSQEINKLAIRHAIEKGGFTAGKILKVPK